MTDDRFESVGYVKGITPGHFEDSFVAELNNGDKLYGSKKKRDGTPSKVWPLIQQSFAGEKDFKWTGNLKQDDKGSFRTVTWGFEVEDQQPSVPAGNISSADLPPEIAKSLEHAKELSESRSNGHKADDRNASFALSYAKDFVGSMIQKSDGTFADPDELKARVLDYADTFKEWLDQQATKP